MYKRGDNWISDFIHHGERHIRSWGAISKTVAAERDRKFRVEVKEGRHAEKSRQITFEKFSEKYLEYIKVNKKPNTHRKYGFSIKMLMPHFTGVLIEKIHALAVEKYKSERKKQGAMPATINRDVATLRNMLNLAVEWKYLKKNPIEGIKTFKEQNQAMWALGHDEEQRLLVECEKSAQRKEAKYLRDLVVFALNSGMRQAEIFRLRVEDIDLSARSLTVHETKNGYSRKVPINERLFEVLQRRIAGQRNGWIFFNSEGGPLTVLTNAYWYAVKQAGLEKVVNGRRVRFRFHDCRHTFGTRLGEAGVDLKTLMEIMGHRTHTMAMRYQHPSRDHKLNAVRVLDQLPQDFTTGQEEAAKKVINLRR